MSTSHSPSPTLAALYASHARLTSKMFEEGLSTSERRRLNRCHRLIDRVLEPSVAYIHFCYVASVRGGRARRRALRRVREIVATWKSTQ